MPTNVDLSYTPGLLQSGTFDAIDFRQMIGMVRGEGIDASGDFAVSEDSGGASMDLEVAAGQAWVQGDAVADQGLYYVRETATQTVTLSTADGSNPRIDQVVLRVYDDEHDGSGSNKASIEIIDGTASAGATLSNLTGAASLPNGALRLAYVLVAAGDTTITNADIQAAAPMAYVPGRVIASSSITSNAVGATDLTSLSIVGDGVHDVLVQWHSTQLYSSGAAGTNVGYELRDASGGGGNQLAEVQFSSPAGNYAQVCQGFYLDAAPSGSTNYYWYQYASAGTVTTPAAATYPATLIASYV